MHTLSDLAALVVQSYGNLTLEKFSQKGIGFDSESMCPGLNPKPRALSIYYNDEATTITDRFH